MRAALRRARSPNCVDAPGARQARRITEIALARAALLWRAHLERGCFSYELRRAALVRNARLTEYALALALGCRLELNLPRRELLPLVVEQALVSLAVGIQLRFAPG